MITHVGQRVQLRYSLEQFKGTVTRVSKDGFRVQFDDESRKVGQPRTRSVFKWNQDHLFVPEGSAEVRVVEDSRLDIPAELLKRYGISED